MDGINRSVARNIASTACRQFRWTWLAILILPLIFVSPAQAAPDLECASYFKPAKNHDYPFAWRQNNRCEGFTNENVAYTPSSIKISSFGFGVLGADGRQRIVNPTEHDIELHGRYFSNSRFYRLVARIEPGESLEWEYPQQLLEGGRKRLERIWLQASVPGDKDDMLTPYKISDASELYVGVMSTDLQFNAVHVQINDDKNREICNYIHPVGYTVEKRDQVSFKLKPCGQALTSKARLAVRALMLLGELDLLEDNSKTDAIWIRQ